MSTCPQGRDVYVRLPMNLGSSLRLMAISSTTSKIEEE
nr:unnamed protein product [Brassica rapa]